MKRILIAPDKFKGSLTSFQACEAIAEGIAEAAVTILPMADGGDGFAAVMKHYLTTETIECPSVDALGRPISASYELDRKNATAIIELASASALVLLQDHERNARKTSTYGTGLLIKDALSRGINRILLGLGGSATNDAGMGILEALGFQLLNKEGGLLPANGENCRLIDRILPPLNTGPENLPFKSVQFELACDVQNVLYGTQGAAYIYGPQKGAGPEDVQILDEGLRNIARVIHRQTGKDIAGIPGTGAAGGIAAGLMAFFQVSLISGIDLVIQASKITSLLAGCDTLITGEGRIDSQTQEGKVVSRLAGMAARLHIPVIAFCGIADPEILHAGIDGIRPEDIHVITPAEMDRQQAMKNAAALLTDKTREYFNRSV